MPNELTIKEKLCFCTTKIDAIETDDSACSGTGFFFNARLNEQRVAPFIITNKHMACGKKSLTFYLSQKSQEGTPKLEQPLKIDMSTDELNKYIYGHPDPNVDLCAIAINPILTQAKHQGFEVFYQTLSNKDIATAEKLEELDAYEEVMMVGYPNALWDDVHNMPLIRRGITATWPKLDFRGKREFLIDAACFPGSSGSPVFICNTGVYYNKKEKDAMLGTRFMLLGVQYAVPLRTNKGEVSVKSTAKAFHLEAELKEMINLGYIIKADCILDIIEEFKKKLPI